MDKTPKMNNQEIEALANLLAKFYQGHRSDIMLGEAMSIIKIIDRLDSLSTKEGVMSYLQKDR